MSSWTNATAPVTTRGVLRAAETARRSSLAREFPVSTALQPFVERYWSVRWDHSGSTPYRAEVLGHPSVNLTAEFGTRPRFGAVLPAVLLHGVPTRRFVVDLEGQGAVTAAKFRPGGLTAMTGLSPAPDSVSPAPPSLVRAPDVLLAELQAAPDGTARAWCLDALLAPLAREPDPAYRHLQEVLGEMQRDSGLVRVDQVAAGAGTTVRSLQRLFARYVGVGPKAVLARYRVQNALAEMDAGRAGDLAELAVTLGWFDQGHFSREFHAAVGVTPTAYVESVRRDSTG